MKKECLMFCHSTLRTKTGFFIFIRETMVEKMEIFHKNPNVCVSFCREGDLYIQSPQIGCSHSMQFQSVLVFGKIEFITDFEEKTETLHKIIHHYTDNREYSLGKPAIENVACYKVKIEKITERQRDIV